MAPAVAAIVFFLLAGVNRVLEALDKPMPIGEAHCSTWNKNGLAVWTLRIGKQEIPGRWVIVDREFRPMQ
ncbi:MAG: hypothetical protein ACLP7Q_04810 [Isosphaeraceae bacterium]